MKDIKVIGREYEWERLDDCIDKEETQLVVVYGRRRVGKTFLVNEYFKDRFDFKITGVYNQPSKIQLFNFLEELNRRSEKKYSMPKDWLEAFSLLRDYIETLPKDRKQIVFFDEMPWMDTPRAGFLPAFEWFWNSWGSARDNLVLIVCGSATSWMVDNIDKNRGGLYNRTTCKLFLEPFNLNETEQFLKNAGVVWNRHTITECYMIMGGIPYYLSLIKSNLTFEANIDNIFFRNKSELFDEFNNLYSTLFKNSSAYVKVVEVLSTKRSGYSRGEIAKKTKLPDNGNLTTILNNLEYSGFIRIMGTYNKKRKDMIYQLADYYTAFYFKFLKDSFGVDEHFWANSVDNPIRNAWAGLTFEQVCMDHISQIKKKLGISGVLTEVSTWRKQKVEDGDGVQIDLLIDRRDNVINVCEIKYSKDEYVIDKEYNKSLRNKVETFRNTTNTKKALHLTMITTYGVKRNLYGNEINFQVVLDDLFV